MNEQEKMAAFLKNRTVRFPRSYSNENARAVVQKRYGWKEIKVWRNSAGVFAKEDRNE